jgi:hypothetical protein
VVRKIKIEEEQKKIFSKIKKTVLKEIALKWPDAKKTPGNDNDV